MEQVKYARRDTFARRVMFARVKKRIIKKKKINLKSKKKEKRSYRPRVRVRVLVIVKII